MATRDTALATDDWTGFTDGQSISSSGNWQDINATGNGAVIVETTNGPMTQSAAGASTADDGAAAVWTGAGTFDNDQWAEVQFLTSWQSAAYQTGVIVRASTDTDTNRDCYFLQVTHNGNGALDTYLGKIVNGTYTSLYSEVDVTWADNDLLSLEVEGTTLRGMKNGALINANFEVTDSSLSTGNPGVWAAGTRTSGDLGALNWAAGNFAGGASVAPLAHYHYQNNMG